MHRLGRIAALAALIAAFALPASAGAASSAYVTNSSSDTISQYDIGAGGRLSPKSNPYVSAAVPEFPTASPDGKSLYVGNDANQVLQYSVGPDGSLTFGSFVALPEPGPTQPSNDVLMVAVSPDGRSLYALSQAGPGQPGSLIGQYDVNQGGTLSPKNPATVSTGFLPQGLVVSPDGASLYVAASDAHGNGTVYEYDIAANGTLTPKASPTIASTGAPAAIAIAPDGRSVYVAAGQQIDQYDVGPGGELMPKSPPSVSSLGNNPIAVSPDGQSLYMSQGSVIRQYTIGSGGTLTPKSSPTVPTGQNATDGITVSADGKSVYVAGGNPNNDVLQYDVGAGGLLSAKNPPSVSAGNLPVGVAVLPEQGPVASFSATPGPPGTPTKFDGTSSTDANGPIGSYTWSFGDGTTATNAGATPSHTYAAPGTYQVTLTLTDANGCSTTIYMGQTDACNASSATLTRSVTITLPPVIAATTQPANGLTTATATLHGLVATDQAPVTWSFQYGPSKFYGKSTAAQTIPAGKKTMPLPVSSTVTHLKPLTVYHFRLVASTQAADGQTVTSYGRDMTFTTKPTGTLQFSLSKLRVLGGLITLPLKCASNVPCSGRLTITTKTGKHKKTRTLQCVAVSFKLKAKSKKSLEARVSHACMSLLSAGHGHRINARLASQSATGQRTPNKNVILTL